MQSINYSAIGLLAIVTHLILNAGYIKRHHTSQEGREYKHFLTAVFLYYLTDVAWGILDTFGNATLLYIDTLAYYTSLAFTVVYCCKYVIAFLHLHHFLAKTYKMIGLAFGLGVVPALVVNYFHPIFFSFDGAGHYSTHLLRYFIIILQVLMYASISIVALVSVLRSKGATRRRNTTILYFGLIMTTALVLQTIYTLLPFYSAGLMLGTLVIHIFIYENDNATQLREITQLNNEISKEKHSQEAYLSIISNAGIGVWYIFLKEGEPERMRADKKMKDLLGIAGKNLSEEETYQAWYSRIVESAMPSVQASVQEMMNGKFSENTYEWDHPQKGIIYVRCGGTAQSMPDGTHILSGYHAEVTDLVVKDKEHEKSLQQARWRAEAASRAKTIFLNNMSHDIRTPMNAILGFTHLMSQKTDQPDIVADYIVKIEHSGRYLLSLINNVLDMASIESGKATLNEEFYDMLDENNSVLPHFQAMLQSKQLTLHATMDVQHRYVLIDHVKVHEIMSNLVSNAIKYTPEGGHIALSCKEMPSQLEGCAKYVFKVADTGVGMTKEFAAHVFDMFSRERTTTESKIVGTGLGMSIVKKLIELMNGTIDVQTEPGKGTTITFCIDHKIVLDPEQYIAQNLDKDTGGPHLAHRRVLLAEDNDLNAEIATTILEDAGLKVERAADGVVCIKMLTEAEAGYYDAILMDVQMPNLNGCDATMRIRALSDKTKAAIPIVAMTANAFEEDKRKVLEAGMDAHLSKPIDIDALMQTLTSVLASRTKRESDDHD